MSNLTGAERGRYVQNMFTRIAPHYDLMNRIMTAGQDVNWRREVIRRAALPLNGRLLDLGAGTGDLAAEALRQQPGCHAVAADFTLEMMHIGHKKLTGQTANGNHITWSGADAHQLPFPNEAFDAVVSGFLLRNVSNLPRCLDEQRRVLKPGGMTVSLDTTPPPESLWAPLIRFHLHTVIPTVGRMLTGQGDAYNYLPETTENFLEAEQLAKRMSEAGFQGIGFQRLMFGAIAIHWGRKP